MLDFYLLGLGRSGTSAFCQALNLHPHIYCGIERFPLALKPDSIVFPESFLDDSIKANPVGLSHAQDHLGKTDNLEKITVVGDKSPRKFYCPSHLDQTHANVLIYRSYTNTTASWDARANNSEDTWSASRTGLFFFLDLLLMLNVLPFTNRLAIVNYDALFFEDYSAELNHVFNIVGVEVDAFDVEHFEDRFFRQRRDYVKKSTQLRYDKFAAYIGLDEFENEFFDCKLDARINLLKDYADHIKTNRARFFNGFVDTVTACEMEELYWLTSVIGKNLCFDDHQRFFPGIDSTFKWLLDNPADQSTVTLLKLVDRYPKLGSALLELSKRYYRANQLKLAIDYALRARSTIEKSPHHLIYFGRLLIQDGQSQCAQHILQRALDLDREYHPAYLQLNQLYLQTNAFDKAMVAIENALKLDPANPKYHFHRGNTLIRTGDTERAFAAYNKSLEIDPEMQAAYVQLSHLWVQKQQIEQAISAIEKAISLDEGKANYHLHLGNLRTRMGDKAAAIEAYQKAKDLNPEIKVPLS